MYSYSYRYDLLGHAKDLSGLNMPKYPDPIIARIRGIRGLSAAIARACGTHRSAVYQWRRVPPARVLVVAQIMKLKPEAIRPDIFRPIRRARRKR